MCGEDLSLKSYIIDTKAELLWIQGDLDGAIEAIQTAIDIDPESGLSNEEACKIADNLGLNGNAHNQMVEFVRSLYNAYNKSDSSLFEIHYLGMKII